MERVFLAVEQSDDTKQFAILTNEETEAEACAKAEEIAKQRRPNKTPHRYTTKQFLRVVRAESSERTQDEESADIKEHLANCLICDEENEVFCPFYWKAGKP